MHLRTRWVSGLAIAAAWAAQSTAVAQGDGAENERQRAGVSGSGDEIVVTASRRPQEINKIARSVIVIGPELITENLNKSSNINDLISAAIPGFGPPIQNDIVRAQTLRGRTPQFLIDGIPLGFNGGAGFGSSELAKFDPEILGRVEVLYGPNAVYGAGSTGGVIQFFTKEASSEPIEIRLRQQFSTFFAADNPFNDESLSYKTTIGASGTVNKFDYVLNYSFDSVNGIIDGEGDLNNPVFYGFEDEKTFFSKVGFNITETQRIEAFYNYQELNPDGRNYLVSITDDGRAIGQEDPNQLAFNYGSDNEPINEKEFWNVRYTNDALFGGSLLLQYYGRDEERISEFIDLRLNAQAPTWPEEFPDNYQSFFTDEGYGIRSQYARSITDRLNILVGVDYDEQERASDAVVFEITPDFDDTRLVSTPIDQGRFLFPVKLETLGIFGQGELELSDRLRLSGGLRWEDVSFEIGGGRRIFERTLDDEGNQVSRAGGSGDNDGIAWNIGVSFDATEWLTVFGNFSQGFELPSLAGIAGQVPPDQALVSSDAIDPQVVDNYEIGFRGAYGIWDYSIAGFYSDSELGQNFLYNPETLAGEFNRAPQENYGFETVIGVNPTDVLRLSAAFSWNDGDFENEGDGLGSRPLSGLDVQPYKLVINANYDVNDDLQLNAQILNVGDRDRAFDEGVDAYPFEGYTQVDVGAFYDVGPGTLGVQITNLLDKDYITVGNQTYVNNLIFAPRVVGAPGRQLIVAYNLTF
ncbi:MAG: TonB-dependent receptor [Pseudomonadota bacterium]